MQVKLNTSQNQTPQKTNPQNFQIQQPQQPQNLNSLPMDQLYQLLLQQLQKQQLHQQKQQIQQNDEFIIKSGMKASYIALKVEQVLILKKKVVLSALGYAIPIAIDATLLVRKDLSKQQINLKNIDIELFEKEVILGGKKNKTISGVRITLSI
jgi:DNA-binding protein